MGAEQKAAAVEATGAGGDKKDDAKVVSVYKMDMHCEGCAKKIKRAVKHLEGVEEVKTDCEGNKLTVTGNVDPAKVKASWRRKTKKKVEIVSPQPKKDGGDKKPEQKAEKKPEEKNPRRRNHPKEEAAASGSGAKVEVSKMEYYQHRHPLTGSMECLVTVTQWSPNTGTTRLKKQELESPAKSGVNMLRTVEESIKRELSSSLKAALNAVAEQPLKPPCGRAKITKKLGRPPNKIEVFRATHTKKGADGVFIDGKSQRADEDYASAIVEKYDSNSESLPIFGMDMWIEVSGGFNKGMVYGFGSSAKSQTSRSSTSQSCTFAYPGPSSQPAMTQEEIQQLIDKKASRMRVEMKAEILDQVRKELKTTGGTQFAKSLYPTTSYSTNP
ncbi:hypothetical protein GH714_028296 [Hevea brasiliensis]|uniref:HMA domain-containing protein n=1 Tax=Hevea brasiliensis TaxID=3981 RepID=A0A6A6MEF2_HEVBR|nr:hypothetical protein GH714_028296 [Hevea brasiliensis]